MGNPYLCGTTLWKSVHIVSVLSLSGFPAEAELRQVEAGLKSDIVTPEDGLAGTSMTSAQRSPVC